MSSAVELVNALHKYRSLLIKIQDDELKTEATSGNQSIKFLRSVSLSYSFLKLKLDVLSQSVERTRQTSASYMQCTLRIDKEAVLFEELYCMDKEREFYLRDFIQQQRPKTWDASMSENIYGAETLRYLEIADEIAKEGYLCASGDNYNPGFFSKIVINDDGIILEQVNRMNAKSIDHKQDYHMRDLEFFIPLSNQREHLSFQNYKIGKMLITFEDHSSKNNKFCGDRILEKIIEKQSQFIH